MSANTIEVIAKEKFSSLSYHELMVLNTRFNSYKRTIHENIESVYESVMEIGECLRNIKDEELYLIDGYSNIYEFALSVFNFSETTVKNYIGLFERFKDKPEIAEKGFSFSQLVELKSVEDNIDVFDSSMTVKEIRQAKKNIAFQNTLSQRQKELIGFFENLKKSIDMVFEEVLISPEVTFKKVNVLNDFQPELKYKFYKIELCFFLIPNGESLCTMCTRSPITNKCLETRYSKDFSANEIELISDEIRSFLKKERKAYEENLQRKQKVKEEVKKVVEAEKKNINEEDPLYLLTNNEQRKEFVLDMKNWLLVEETLGIKFYKFKYLDFGLYIHKTWNELHTYKVYYSIKDGVHYIGATISLSVIVDAIKDYRQTLLS